MVIYDVDIL